MLSKYKSISIKINLPTVKVMNMQNWIFENKFYYIIGV